MSSDKWYFNEEALSATPSRQCGYSQEKEEAVIVHTASFIQDLGRRLSLPLLCINTAVLYMQRFYMFHPMTVFDRYCVGASALFLAAKVEEHPRKIEHIFQVARHYGLYRDKSVKDSVYIDDLLLNENVLIMTLGFELQVQHPHHHILRMTYGLLDKSVQETAYILATYCLHLTRMCLVYKQIKIACMCVYLASKKSPQAMTNNSAPWLQYNEENITEEVLNSLSEEFHTQCAKSPEKCRQSTLLAIPESIIRRFASSHEEAPRSTNLGILHEDLKKYATYRKLTNVNKNAAVTEETADESSHDSNKHSRKLKQTPKKIHEVPEMNKDNSEQTKSAFPGHNDTAAGMQNLQYLEARSNDQKSIEMYDQKPTLKFKKKSLFSPEYPELTSDTSENLNSDTLLTNSNDGLTKTDSFYHKNVTIDSPIAFNNSSITEIEPFHWGSLDAISQHVISENPLPADSLAKSMQGNSTEITETTAKHCAANVENVKTDPPLQLHNLTDNMNLNSLETKLKPNSVKSDIVKINRRPKEGLILPTHSIVNTQDNSVEAKRRPSKVHVVNSNIVKSDHHLLPLPQSYPGGHKHHISPAKNATLSKNSGIVQAGGSKYHSGNPDKIKSHIHPKEVPPLNSSTNLADQKVRPSKQHTAIPNIVKPDNRQKQVPLPPSQPTGHPHNSADRKATHSKHHAVDSKTMSTIPLCVNSDMNKSDHLPPSPDIASRVSADPKAKYSKHSAVNANIHNSPETRASQPRAVDSKTYRPLEGAVPPHSTNKVQQDSANLKVVSTKHHPIIYEKIKTDYRQLEELKPPYPAENMQNCARDQSHRPVNSKVDNRQLQGLPPRLNLGNRVPHSTNNKMSSLQNPAMTNDAPRQTSSLADNQNLPNHSNIHKSHSNLQSNDLVKGALISEPTSLLVPTKAISQQIPKEKAGFPKHRSSTNVTSDSFKNNNSMSLLTKKNNIPLHSSNTKKNSSQESTALDDEKSKTCLMSHTSNNNAESKNRSSSHHEKLRTDGDQTKQSPYTVSISKGSSGLKLKISNNRSATSEELTKHYRQEYSSVSGSDLGREKHKSSRKHRLSASDTTPDGDHKSVPGTEDRNPKRFKHNHRE